MTKTEQIINIVRDLENENRQLRRSNAAFKANATRRRGRNINITETI